jgi:hypothetical protein
LHPEWRSFLSHRIYDLTPLRLDGLKVPNTPLREGLREHVRWLEAQKNGARLSGDRHLTGFPGQPSEVRRRLVAPSMKRRTRGSSRREVYWYVIFTPVTAAPGSAQMIT